MPGTVSLYLAVKSAFVQLMLLNVERDVSICMGKALLRKKNAMRKLFLCDRAVD